MVADTYTARNGFIKQGTGNNNNSWGDTFNTSFADIIDRAIGGVNTSAATSGTVDLTTVTPPAGPSTAVDAIQQFTGALVGNLTVQVPNLSKIWLVQNSTSGAFTLKFKTPAGAASSAIPQGGWALVWCDGSNNMLVGLSTALRDVQWLGADGTLALPGISFALEPSSGLRRKAAGVQSLVILGVEIATISATGIDIAPGLAVTVGGVAPVPPGTEVPTAAITAPTGWYLEFGQALNRTTDAALFAALTQTFTGNTHTNTTLDNLSADLRGLGLEGAVLEGVGMATSATIVSVDSATSLTMSLAATNTAVGGAVRACPYGNGDGSTTFTLPDARGTVAAGRDNMGGTTRGKLTTAGSAVDGTRLKTDAGQQNFTILTGNLPPQTPAGTIVSTVNSAAGTKRLVDSVTGGPLGYGGTSSGGDVSNVDVTVTSTFTGTAFAGQNSTPLPNVPPTRIRNVMIKR